MNGLILNLGLKSIRAIIFDSSGDVVISSFRRIDTFINDEYVEQDPKEWWEKSEECIEDVLKGCNNIDFITVSASAACVVPIDYKGEPLMNAIMVSDKRAQREASYISTLESFKRLGYRADCYYSIPRILWIKKNLPDLYKKVYKFISPNDFLLYKLTGKIFTDELNATKYYTVNNNYPIKLLEDLDIEIFKLPEIKEIGFVLDGLDSIVKQDLFSRCIKGDIKVVLTTYDAICAFFGVGVKEEGDACDMSGTVTSLRVLTRKRLKEDNGIIFEQKYKDWNIIGASNNLGGGLIEWLLETFYIKDAYERLENLKGYESARTGLIFLPYLMGERAPLWDNDVRGAFLGIERFHTRDDLARAVLESSGYILRDLIETIEDNDVKVSSLFVSGGLAKIEIVNQIKADIIGKPVYRLKEPEATSLGAYCLARQVLDPSFDKSSLFKIESIYKPNLNNHLIYSEIYKLFKDAYFSLRRFHQVRRDVLNKNNEFRRINL